MTTPQITAEEILLVLNDLVPVHIAEIVVVTHGSAERFDIPQQRMVPVDTPHFWPFAQGEILLLGPSGREPLGEGRKPGKWDVIVQPCSSFAEARAMSERVKAEPAQFTQAYWDARKAERTTGGAA